MDLSGLIFVVLAVAWAGYLVPRALRQHDDLEAHRPIDEFSDTIRVLDRRQSGTPSPASRSSVDRSAPVSATHPAAVADRPPATRTAARRAAQRRRRVLYVLLSLAAVVAGLAASGTVSWGWTAAPTALVVAWLVLSASLGRRERVVRPRTATPAPLVVEQEPARAAASAAAPVVTEVDEVAAEDDGALWDPLPLTLPTYVTKPAARRTVRTIDLTRPAAAEAPSPAAEEAAPAAETPVEDAPVADAEQARRAV